MLFAAYLVYDTQIIVGGKKRELDIDEYIFGNLIIIYNLASLMLYLDIINMFIYILDLLRRL